MLKTLQLLIVEDETRIRAGIRNDLSAMGSINVVGECGTVAEAVEAIRANRPDLILLDVQLPDGTGFDVVRQIGPQQMPAVVFVTAFDTYAIQAFEVNAIDYLLKPFDDSRLQESIDRARERLSPGLVLARQLEGLIELQEQRWLQRVVVRGLERFDFVPVESIDWIESANNYTVLHCGEKNHILSETLTGLEGRLDPSKFLRVHRRRIVNLSRLMTIHSLAGGTYEMELSTGVQLQTGRQYREVIHVLTKNRPTK